MYLFVVYFSFGSFHLSKHPSLCELFWYPSPDDGYWNQNVNVNFTSWYIHLFGLCFFCYLHIYIYTHTVPLALWVECSNGLGDWGSISGRVIQKTQKMVFDATLLNTQHYKAWDQGVHRAIQGKGYPLPTPWCCSPWKGAFRLLSVIVANFTSYIYEQDLVLNGWYAIQPNQPTNFMIITLAIFVRERKMNKKFISGFIVKLV